MIKYIFFFILLFISIIFSFSNPTLTKDFLISSKWGPEEGSYGLYLTFNQNNSYQYHSSGEGGINNLSGKYILLENSVILEPNSGDLDDIFKPLTFKQPFVLRVDTNSFYHSQYLRGNRWSFYNLNSAPINCDKTVEGITLSFVPQRKCVINTNSYLRNGPGRQYNYYVFTFHDPATPLKDTPFLPIKYELVIIGKTKEIEQIGDLKGFWYYVDIPLSWYDHVILNEDRSMSYGPGLKAWIFSPLVDE